MATEQKAVRREIDRVRNEQRTAASSQPRLLPVGHVVAEDFARLDDGTLIETIENPNDPARALLAMCQHGQIRVVEKFKAERCVYVPLRRQAGILKHMLLPDGVENYESTERLMGDILLLITQCIDIDHNVMAVIAFVMATWLFDRLPIAPYLGIVGLPRSGKTTLLRVLRLLCRRALLISDITSAAFYHLYTRLTPTLLIDETATIDQQKTVFHILRTGSTKDVTAFRKGQCFNAYGPKVVSWVELPNDAALNSRFVTLALQESKRSDLLKVDDPRIVNFAAQLRRRLLYYRLAQYGSIVDCKPPGIDQLHSRTRDLYEALALPIRDHDDACNALLDLFKMQEELAREPLAPEAAALLGALSRIPETGCGILVNLLSRYVNAILEDHHEHLRVTPHRVGRLLTSFGFTNRYRTNQGYVLYLDEESVKRIRELGVRYGIERAAN